MGMLQKRLCDDNKGQLLLLVGILLTVALLVTSMILLNLVNVPPSKVSPASDISIQQEFTSIRSGLGKSIQSKARDLYENGEGVGRLDAVKQAYDIIINDYVITESKNDLDLKVTKRSAIVTYDYVTFLLDLNIKLSNGVVTLEENMDYNLIIPEDYILMADNSGLEPSFTDGFETLDASQWSFSTYQDAPFIIDDRTTVHSVGSGSGWQATFFRNGYQLTHGMAAKFDFMVNTDNTYSVFSIRTNKSDRWGMIAENGKIYTQYGIGGAYTSPADGDLIDPIKIDTWYSGMLVVDELDGFFMLVYEKEEPNNYGTYRFPAGAGGLPEGKSWHFRHWIYRDECYIDKYLEGPLGVGTKLQYVPFYGTSLFGEAEDVDVPPVPASGSVAQGDFDNDGDDDFIVATSKYYPRHWGTKAYYHFEGDNTRAGANRGAGAEPQTLSTYGKDSDNDGTCPDDQSAIRHAAPVIEQGGEYRTSPQYRNPNPISSADEQRGESTRGPTGGWPSNWENIANDPVDSPADTDVRYIDAYDSEDYLFVRLRMSDLYTVWDTDNWHIYFQGEDTSKSYVAEVYLDLSTSPYWGLRIGHFDGSWTTIAGWHWYADIFPNSFDGPANNYGCNFDNHNGLLNAPESIGFYFKWSWLDNYEPSSNFDPGVRMGFHARTYWDIFAEDVAPDEDSFEAKYTIGAKLTVSSNHGSPSPAVGEHWYYKTRVISANVNSPADGYVCTGWQGSGSVPASGATNSVTFTIVEDSTLVWLWGGEPRLDVSPKNGISYARSEVNQSYPFTATYEVTAPLTYTALSQCRIRIKRGNDGSNCFYGYYNEGSDHFYLRNDADTAWIDAGAAGALSDVENSYCVLKASTSRNPVGNQITIIWSVEFKFAWNDDFCDICLYSLMDNGENSGWLDLGDWTIENDMELLDPEGLTFTGLKQGIIRPGGWAEVNEEIVVGGNGTGIVVYEGSAEPVSPAYYDIEVDTSDSRGPWTDTGGPDGEFSISAYADTVADLTGDTYAVDICNVPPGSTDPSPYKWGIIKTDISIVGGDDVRDSSGRNNNGTMYNGPTYGEGIISDSLVFDGSNDLVKVPHGVLNNSEEFTIELWIKTTDSNSAGLVTGANDVNDNELLLFITGNGNLRAYIKNQQSPDGTTVVNDGQWHHVVMLRYGDRVAVVVDGHDIDIDWTGAPAGPLSIFPNGLWLGGDQDIVGGGWDSVQAYQGYMDEFRVLEGTLNIAEIRADYQVRKGGSVFYYENIGSGNTFIQRGSVGSFRDYGAGDIIVGDFNDDDKLDFGLSNLGPYPLGEIKMFYGDGSGNFPFTYRIKDLATPVTLMSGDYDEDGHRDLVCTGATPGNLYLIRGYGNGTFETDFVRTILETPFTHVYKAVSADFDNDLHLDIVVISPNDIGVEIKEGWGYIYKGRGDGTFNREPEFAGLHNIRNGECVPVFVNRDAYYELVLVNSHSHHLEEWYNNGLGNFATPGIIHHIYYSNIASLDGPG